MKNIKARFLKPDGWYVTEFQEPNEPDTYKCFITKEDFSKSRKMEIGLLVVVTKNVQKTTSMTASQTAYNYIQEKAEMKYDKYPEVLTTNFDPFKVFSVHIKEISNGISRVSFVRAIGNDGTGTFYAVTYTTTEELFLEDESNDFALSGPMTSMQTIDDEF